MAEKYKFEIPRHHKSIIKVIGVGGGGSNAVNHMFNQGIKDVEFVVCNTDSQALKGSPVPNKLQIGIDLTEGLGAGANPEKGRNAALESKEDIRELLSTDTKMVFITAGMGGGTGTGAAPVIAKVARELDILTVGIVTAPFGFEGKKKLKQAEEGIRELKDSCDTVLVILNDKLREIYGNLSITQAFAQADNILTTAAKGIAEIITVPGYVNVDFEDVKTVMRNSGAATMGSAQTEGEGRARRAAELAIASPLLNNKTIMGADKILLSIISGEHAELQMDELTEITEFIQERAGENAEVIFGHGVDPDLGNSIRVTVITTGFDSDENNTLIEMKKKVIDLESNKHIRSFDNGDVRKEEIKSKPDFFKEIPRTYTFEDTFEVKSEAPENPKTFMDFPDHYQIVEKDTFPSSGKDARIQDKNSEIEMKKQELYEQSRERILRLRGLRKDSFQSDDFKEKLEVPAYQRKHVNLNDVPYSSEKNISRYNLNDDNQILGNNRFLHDNVD
ncbi:MAG: cell division protein FtsZ [Bacteroidota bacterium]|nr:cell division protein FtsZ [Bacteroidota bacterium]